MPKARIQVLSIWPFVEIGVHHLSNDWKDLYDGTERLLLFFPGGSRYRFFRNGCEFAEVRLEALEGFAIPTVINVSYVP
jgi:hypothetical protein